MTNLAMYRVFVTLIRAVLVLGQRPDWSGLGARDIRNELWMSLEISVKGGH